MQIISKGILFTLVLASCVLPSSQTHAQYSNPFDGMWVIDMKPESASERTGAARFEERISFINGKPVPHLFSQYGFEPATWSFDFITFQFSVTLKSRAKGQLVWSGRIKSSSNFAGTLIWTRPDAAVWTFHYDARKLPEPEEPIISPTETTP